MADIAPLVDDYKNRFTTLGNVVVEKMNAWKSQALELQPKVVEIAMTNVEFVKTQLTDMAPVGKEPAPYTFLLETYSWVSVCLFVSSIGYLLGSTLGALLLGLVFDTGLAFLSAALFIPLATYLINVKADMIKDDRCALVLTSSLASSVLIGYLLSTRYVGIVPPPMFVYPLVVGLGGAYLSPFMGDKERPQFVGALVGGASLISLILGLFTGSICGLYFIWTVLLAGVAFLDFQMTRTYEGTGGLATSQIFSLALYQFAGLMIMAIFSSSTPPSSSPES